MLLSELLSEVLKKINVFPSQGTNLLLSTLISGIGK